MKRGRLLVTLLVVLGLVQIVYGATWKAYRAGNWGRHSDEADSPWNDAGAQAALATSPGAGDVVYLGNTGATGYAVDVNMASLTCTSITASDGGGSPTPNNGTLTLSQASTTVTANLFAGTAALLVVNTKTLVLGGTSTVTGGSGSSAYGINVQANSTVTVPNVTGGSGSSAHGLYYAGSSANLTVTGTITGGSGGSASGLWINTATNPTLTNAAVVGGSAASCPGITNQSSSTYTVSSATGGSAAGAHGIYVYLGTPTVTIGTVKGGSNIGAGGLVSLVGGTFTINAVDNTGTGPALGAGTIKLAAGVKLQYKDTGGSAKNFYGADLMPAASDVKDGVTYGGGDYEGTYVGGGIYSAFTPGFE